MASEFFIPTPTYVPSLKVSVGSARLSLEELCAACGIRCRASGEWIKRSVYISNGPVWRVTAEPGEWGAVMIEGPGDLLPQSLKILAYSLFDLVARESLRGTALSKLSPPRGRPTTGRALTNKERQQRYRKGIKAKTLARRPYSA